MPAFTTEDLLRCLELSSEDDATWVGQNLPLDYYRVFGGQVLAQAITAAQQVAGDKTVKSIAMLFPREGDTAKPMQYRTEVHQNGRTYATVGLTAFQDDRVIATASISLHIDEPGLDRNDPMPDVKGPEDSADVDLGMVPWSTRIVDGVDLSDLAAAPPTFAFWQQAEGLPETRSVHQALLAHSTDLTLIGTALRPFDGVSQAQSTKSLHTAVTSHSMWFHRPFSLNEWLLVAQHSPVVANGRAFGRGDVFTTDGQLVASFAQEAMVRSIAT